MAQYLQLKTEIESYKARLVAVSKTKPAAQIQTLYDNGQRIFGENKVQELLDKKDELPKDIEWHLIGHLQSNKVKQIIPHVALIHSIDSLKLLFEIEKQAAKINKHINVLLQVYIATEETKFGLDMTEIIEIMDYYFADAKPLKHIHIRGIMGMASNTEDENQIRTEFKKLKQIFSHLKQSYFIADDGFREVSMGMSSDYKIALEEGSTLVRIGSLLFGNRN